MLICVLFLCFNLRSVLWIVSESVREPSRFRRWLDFQCRYRSTAL